MTRITGELSDSRQYFPAVPEQDANAPPDLRQRLRETGEPARLAHLTHHPLPIGMIAVLQASRGVAPDRLDVRPGIGGVQYVHVRRRHRERGKPLRLCAAQRRAIGGDVAKAPAMP